jgi:hypothetical protein
MSGDEGFRSQDVKELARTVKQSPMTGAIWNLLQPAECRSRDISVQTSEDAQLMKMGLMAVLAFLFTTDPAWSQDRSSRITTSGEIRIPNSRELEREVFARPRNDFSSIDSIADGEMDRMDREIDRLLVRGICEGC